MSYSLTVVLLLAIGFTLASIFGYFCWRIKVSPILGYLLAGYFIGPYSPGFVADLHVSEQLAEVGVILMMFGVGLNFKVQDLLQVKNIAIPGAIGQTLISALLATGFVYFFGWPLERGIILGLAIGVASTVVLVRMLADYQLLNTREGHIAVGWLVVEDIITVVILILLPNLSKVLNGTSVSAHHLVIPIVILIIKFILLILILSTFGHKLVSYALAKVMHTRSHELVTIAILASIFILATGTTFLFGISIALGAFIAGMIIGQTEARNQALIHSLAMKDAFMAIFFISVGMLFNPMAIVQNFPLFIGILAIILLVKPLVAFLITIALKYPFKAAITIAAALAQIGEFSFILSEESMKYNLLTDAGYDIIVACALISIALNPLIFKIIRRKSVKGKI